MDWIRHRRFQAYGDDHAYRAGYTYINNHAVPTLTGVPRYSDGGDLHLPRSTYLGAAWSRWRNTNQDGFLELRQDIGYWTSQVSLRHGTGTNVPFTASALGEIDRATGTGATLGSGYWPDYGDKQTGIDLFFSGPVQLFGRTHTLLIAATGRKDHLDWSENDQLVSINGIPADVFNFDPYTVPKFTPGPTLFYHYHIREKQAGIYGSARLSLSDPLTIILGGRMSWWDRRTEYTDDGMVFSGPSRATKNAIFTPYAGIVYKVGESTSVYASYADIFNPQSGLEYPGTILPPIIGANYEAGVKVVLFGDRLNATLAVFQIEQTNQAVSDPAHPCADSEPICYMIPSGKVRSRGVEAEISGDISASLKISAGYTYADTKYIEDTDASGNPTANQGRIFNSYTPRHLLKLWVDWTLPDSLDRISLGGGVQAQSKIYVENDRISISQPTYALINARLFYKLTDSLTASVNLNNMLDNIYYVK